MNWANLATSSGFTPIACDAAAPKRARGRYAVDTIDSFMTLVDQLRDDVHFAPRVYVNRQARRVVAVLNDVVTAKRAVDESEACRADDDEEHHAAMTKDAPVERIPDITRSGT